MRKILVDSDPILGAIPGPLAIATRGDRIWLAGGGRGGSAVLRFEDERWHPGPSSSAHGLRDVMFVDDERAIVCGEKGFVAYVSKDDHFVFPPLTSGCLYSLARGPDGAIWVSGDNAYLAKIHDKRVEVVTTPHRNRLLRLAFLGDELLIATSHGFARGDTLVIETPAPLASIAIATGGSVAVCGDAGQLFLDGTKIAAPAIDLERIAYDARHDRFLLGGENGYTAAMLRDGTLVENEPLDPAYRITAFAPFRDGMLAGGWRQTGAPYRFVGALYYDGNDPLDAIAQPPMQSLPPRPTRSFEFTRPLVTLADALDLSVEEATARIPNVSWPETQLERVRFLDGDVHVADVDELFAMNNERGYFVAITGNLVVDGCLDAVAGGDCYDSTLVIGGNVWAASAIFRYGIKAAIGGDLEVATAIICSHGDDGGTLWANRIRAQVLAYSCYFPKPDAEFDAFLFGNVYGEKSFPTDRAAEVFISAALEDGGLDEDAAGELLRAGTTILRS